MVTFTNLVHVADLAAVFGPPVAYVGLVSTLQRVSPKRLRPLRPYRSLYNAGMALYSFFVAVALASKLVVNERFASPHALLCTASPGVPVGWYASKLVEWVDTVYIFEAGRAPSSLHLRHHATAASVVALNLAGRSVPTPLLDLASALNAAVHFNMYLYYSHPALFRDMRKNITRFQVLQHHILCVAALRTRLAVPLW